MIDYDFEQIEIAYNPRDDSEFRLQHGAGLPQFSLAELSASRVNQQHQRQLQSLWKQLEAERRLVSRSRSSDRQQMLMRQQLLSARVRRRRSHLSVSERSQLASLDEAGRLRMPTGFVRVAPFDSAAVLETARRRLFVRRAGELPAYLRRIKSEQATSAATAATEAVDNPDSPSSEGSAASAENDSDNDEADVRTDRDFPPMCRLVQSAAADARAATALAGDDVTRTWGTFNGLGGPASSQGRLRLRRRQRQQQQQFSHLHQHQHQQRRQQQQQEMQHTMLESEKLRMRSLSAGPVRDFVDSLR